MTWNCERHARSYSLQYSESEEITFFAVEPSLQARDSRDGVWLQPIILAAWYPGRERQCPDLLMFLLPLSLFAPPKSPHLRHREGMDSMN